MITLVPNSFGSPLREFNPCHDPKSGRFCDSERGGDWEEGDYFYQRLDARKDYEPPELVHKVVRDGGMWGYSHGNSSYMRGLAAHMMGIPGWAPEGNWVGQGPYAAPEKSISKAVTTFLENIASSPGSEEPLYHGFQNTRRASFKVGDTVRLPLLATAGKPDTVSYGIRLEPKDQEAEPTVFAFEKGTQMVGYSKWNKAAAKEFGYVWTEALVAGGFEVTKVTRAVHPWSVRFGPLPVRIVYLKQTETWDPKTGWRKR